MKNERSFLPQEGRFSKGLFHLVFSGTTYQAIDIFTAGASGAKIYKLAVTHPGYVTDNGLFIDSNVINLLRPSKYVANFGGCFGAGSRIVANILVWIMDPANPATTKTLVNLFENIATDSGGIMVPNDLLLGAQLAQKVDADGNRYWNIPAGWVINVAVKFLSNAVVTNGANGGEFYLEVAAYGEDY